MAIKWIDDMGAPQQMVFRRADGSVVRPIKVVRGWKVEMVLAALPLLPHLGNFLLDYLAAEVRRRL